MTTLALALVLAAAQGPLTDAQAAELGAFAADRIDANPGAEELERALVEKIASLRKSAGATTAEPAPARGKGKNRKAGKKPARKASNQAAPDTIKNGLTEADRIALGKLVVQEIQADRKGPALLEGLRKELERLRADRVKATSAADAGKARKKKKRGSG